MEGRNDIVDFYEAMNYKGWVKSFLMDPMDSNNEMKVNHYIKYLTGINPEIQERFEVIQYHEVNKRHMGIFSLKAPYYFVVYLKDLEKELLNAGYLCGQFSLYLTTKGMGSFLVGIDKVSRLREDNGENKQSQEDEGWMCIMAFGTPEKKLRQVSRYIDKLGFDKRCIYKTQAKSEIQHILNASVHAPSKLIVRPHRFVINDQRVHIFVKNEAMMTSYQRIAFYLDCGIMLAYLGLKAEELWMSMSIVQWGKLQERGQKNYQYVTTLVFQEQ